MEIFDFTVQESNQKWHTGMVAAMDIADALDRLRIKYKFDLIHVELNAIGSDVVEAEMEGDEHWP